MNWSLSAGNINPLGNDTWASMESFIVGGGKVCRVLTDNVYPHYSLGHADPEAYSIEIGQANDGDGFDPRDLRNAAQICAWASAKHNIPVKVLNYLSTDNHEGAGYVRHDRSANGSTYGKSDPGADFDNTTFEALVNSFLVVPPIQEDEMAKLVRETGSPFVFVWDGIFYSYLRRIEDATEMGISPTINSVAADTLKTYVRGDMGWLANL